MRTLRVELFGGFSSEEKLVNFVNQHKIKEEDILKLVYRSASGTYALFFYV